MNSGNYKLLEKIIINGFDVSFVCVLFKNSLKIKLFFYKEGQDGTSFCKHVKTSFTISSLGGAVVRWSQSTNKGRRRNQAVTLVRRIFS